MKKILITLAVVIVVSVMTAVIFRGKTSGYWIYTGYRLSSAGNYVEADKAFEEALKLDSKNPMVWYLKGCALQRINKYDESLRAFDETLKIGFADNENYYLVRSINVSIIESLNKLGRYDEAIIACDKLLKEPYNYYDHEKQEALRQKAFALGKLERYDEAIVVYTMVIGNTYMASGSIYNRACIYSLKRQKPEALKDLKDAIGIDGSCKNKALYNKDFEWLWDDAEFRQITAKSNHEWHQLGQQLSNQKRYAEAITAFDEALKLSTKESYVWEGKGYACLNLARYDEAIQAYEMALELNPNASNIWYAIACAYSLTMDKEHTLSNLRRAVELAPYIAGSARKDKDFQWLWDDDDFRKITR